MISAKSEEKPESLPLVDSLNEELKRLRAENKGLRGQNERYKRKVGSLNAKTGGLVQEQAGIKSIEAENESNQAEIPHLAREYERKCIDCGGDNPNFKGAPNVFCDGPDCHGRIPMGHVEASDIVKKEGGIVELPTIKKPCFNCGRDDQAKVFLS